MARQHRKKNDDAILFALASGVSVETAAGECGVSDRTVYRRLEDPAFKRQLAAVRADMMGRTAGALTAAGQKAVTTLIALLDEEVSPGTRLAAARAVLEVGLKLREVVDLDALIAELEAKLDEAERDERHPHGRGAQDPSLASRC